MSHSNYKVIQLCFNKETPKSNFNLILKINPNNDYDFNMILTISNDIYVKEFDKILSTHNIISIIYNNNSNKYDFDTKISYTLSDKPLIIEDTYQRNKEIDNIISDLLSYMEKFKEEMNINDEMKVKEEMNLNDEMIVKEEMNLNDEMIVKEEMNLNDEMKVKEEMNLNDEMKVKDDEMNLNNEMKVKDDEMNLNNEMIVKEDDEMNLNNEMKVKDDEMNLNNEMKVKEDDEMNLNDEMKVKDDEMNLNNEMKVKEDDEMKVKEDDEMNLNDEMKVKDDEMNLNDETNLNEEMKVKEDEEIVIVKEETKIIKPKIKIKTPDDEKKKFFNKKKPIIETKLLELLNDSKTNNFLNKTINTNNEKNEIEDKILYHLKLITLSTMDISTNIILIVTELMKFIDNYNLKGIEKKNIILSTIGKFLEDENYPNKDYIINTICPELIDILVSVDKRKIMIRRNVSCLSSCFTS